MDPSWKDSDGPTLLTVMSLGFIMGILMDLILLRHNKDFLTGLILTGFVLIVVCGGPALSARGALRGALAVFAMIGLGMFVTGIYTMY